MFTTQALPLSSRGHVARPLVQAPQCPHDCPPASGTSIALRLGRRLYARQFKMIDYGLAKVSRMLQDGGRLWRTSSACCMVTTTSDKAWLMADGFRVCCSSTTCTAYDPFSSPLPTAFLTALAHYRLRSVHSKLSSNLSECHLPTFGEGCFRTCRFALAQAAHGWLELEAEGETPEMDGKVKLTFPEWVSAVRLHAVWEMMARQGCTAAPARRKLQDQSDGPPLRVVLC